MASSSLAVRSSAEFLGTYLLTLTIGFNVLIESHYNHALSIGAALVVLVYGFGPVSGGHFNPAVTLSVKLADENFSWGDVLPYMGSQLLGAVLASLSLYGIIGTNLNPVAAGAGYDWGHAGVVELIFTYMLTLVILLVAVSNKAAGKEYFGLAIGFALTAGIYSGGYISGAYFNPAIAIASDLVHLFDSGAWSLVWTCFEFAGAALAAQSFKYMHEDRNGDSAALMAEFCGTFLLCSTAAFAIQAKLGAYAVLAIAAGLTSLVFATGTISGGHLNPAVSFAVMLSGRNNSDFSTFGKYFFVQMLAGAVAASIAAWTIGKHAQVNTWQGHGLMATLFIEVLFTAKLTFVVLAVASVKDENLLKNFYGIAIGFCVFVAAPGILNPAVAFSFDFGSAIMGGKWLNWIWWTLAQMGGGALGAAVFRATHAHEYDGIKA